MPIPIWYITKGCNKDLIFWVTFKYEEIIIHEIIPHKISTCHAINTLSISLSLSLPLQRERDQREELENRKMETAQ